MAKFKDNDEVFDLFIPNDGGKPELSIKTYKEAKEQIRVENNMEIHGQHFTDEDVSRTLAERKKLKINKRLPKIILPANKLEMFANWWNEDIRFEKTIPHSFEEGYLFIENEHGLTADKFSPLIKFTAKAYHTSYRNIENQLIEFLDLMKHIKLYFKFINDNTVSVEVYDGEDLLLQRIEFQYGADKDEPEPRIVLYGEEAEKKADVTSLDEVLNNFGMQFVYYLTTCLWYMATTATNIQYVYEEKHPVVEKRHKGVVQVSDTKFIRTPVYDMTKIRKVKVERLITRKKGWTYSHSFQVHGHYRHYKNGNVIFINSYIKGKDKPFKAQEIILEPDKIKEG